MPVLGLGRTFKPRHRQPAARRDNTSKPGLSPSPAAAIDHLVDQTLVNRLAPEEAEELRRRARVTNVSVRDRRRAETILLGEQGLTQQCIAEQLGISRLAVNRWVGRFARHRLDGLKGRAGRGRKPWLPQAAVQQVVGRAVTPTPHLGR
jgi:DNA-directed RNA polymerase specialized sigma24 family protein